MIAALENHLKENEYPSSIVKDREFHSSKQVLEGKAKLPGQAGHGKHPNKARNLTKEEEKLIWKDNPRGIGKHNVVVTYPAFWAPRQARTPRHENG